MTAFGNFVALCTHRAAANGDALAYHYLSPHGEDRALSFGALDRAARRVAARLAASGAPGDRVLIVCPQS
ncbi:hypothetical protein ACX84Z_32340, partial [Burkholderia pseudomallei]